MDCFNIIQRFDFFHLKWSFCYLSTSIIWIYHHFYPFTFEYFFIYSDSINKLVHVPVHQSSSKVYTKKVRFSVLYQYALPAKVNLSYHFLTSCPGCDIVNFNFCGKFLCLHFKVCWESLILKDYLIPLTVMWTVINMSHFYCLLILFRRKLN